MKILVTGSTGQLGREFKALENDYSNISFVFTERAQIDLARPDTLSFIYEVTPDLVIHCAAYTAVDKAEEEAAFARQVNGKSVGTLGRICQDLQIPVIHFSSDYVYHNNLRRPLTEDDPTRPKGLYAKSKLLGENLLMQEHSFPLIFRVSWLYSTYGHNFPKTMLRLGKERESLTIVNDQIGAPTYAKDVAMMVMNLASQAGDKKEWTQWSGIYNYCNTGQTNWSEIASFIMEKAGLSCEIIPIPSIKYPTPAPRPRYSVLNLLKFSRIFKLPVRTWQEAMDDCLKELLNER